MKSRLLRTVLWSAVVLGMFAVPLVLRAADYPPQLEFLSKIKAPKYYHAVGIAQSVDTAQQPVVEMPFEFYWEKGTYALDVRMPGGLPGFYMLGVADTVWLYDFIHGVKLTTLRTESISWLSQLPFTPMQILSVFSISPDAFAEVDTFYTQGGRLVVKTKDKVVYTFDEATKNLLNMRREGTVIGFSDFRDYKKGMWPHRISLNKDIFASGPSEGQEIQLHIREIDFKRHPDIYILNTTPPERLSRTFDLRMSEQ